MEKVMGADVAELEIERIKEEFDIARIGDEEKAVLLRSIMEGRLHVDGDEIVFKLAKPTEQIQELRFSEPTAGQLERAGKGVKATKSADGMEIDISDASRLVINKTSAMTGKDIGFINKIKSRDMKVVEVIVGFFD